MHVFTSWRTTARGGQRKECVQTTHPVSHTRSRLQGRFRRICGVKSAKWPESTGWSEQRGGLPALRQVDPQPHPVGLTPRLRFAVRARTAARNGNSRNGHRYAKTVHPARSCACRVLCRREYTAHQPEATHHLPELCSWPAGWVVGAAQSRKLAGLDRASPSPSQITRHLAGASGRANRGHVHDRGGRLRRCGHNRLPPAARGGIQRGRADAGRRGVRPARWVLSQRTA